MSKKKKALVTGITGQDGSYLAELFLEKGYEVHGIVRRVASDGPAHRFWRVGHVKDRLTLHSATLENFASIHRVVDEVRPDEVYHLAAQSFVADSFADEFSTMNVNVVGTHHILTACRELVRDARFYFAGSSEMFGQVEYSPQTETTPFHPRSPYGIAKVTGFHMTRYYREAYDMFCASGILFNHESPRRGIEFVTRKITSTAARIKLGLETELRLGSLAPRRDWGFAGDYVRAMWLMMQQDEPDDFVIATGVTHSVEDFVRKVFDKLDLNWTDFVVDDPQFHRPAEVNVLQGDASLARDKLGWEPETDLDALIDMMVEADLERAAQSR